MDHRMPVEAGIPNETTAFSIEGVIGADLRTAFAFSYS
jgi:hypothetical protein